MRASHRERLLIGLALALLVGAASAVAPAPGRAAEFGPVPAIEVDAKKAELGRRLFFDKRLSGDVAIKYLGPLGIMPAKNTAVNVMILFTTLSFIIYRRSNKVATVAWVKAGNAAQAALFSAGILNLLFLGVYHGYFTNTVYKVASSIPQVATTLIIIVASTLIDRFMYRGATDAGPLHWGRVPERAQYALFLLAVAFTWLMGLMGYIRSGIRQHWHVVGVVRDNSPDAFTPTLGYAANVVSLGTILFMAMVIFVFWLSQVGGAKTLPAGYWKEQGA